MSAGRAGGDGWRGGRVVPFAAALLFAGAGVFWWRARGAAPPAGDLWERPSRVVSLVRPEARWGPFVDLIARLDPTLSVPAPRLVREAPGLEPAGLEGAAELAAHVQLRPETDGGSVLAVALDPPVDTVLPAIELRLSTGDTGRPRVRGRVLLAGDPPAPLRDLRGRVTLSRADPTAPGPLALELFLQGEDRARRPLSIRAAFAVTVVEAPSSQAAAPQLLPGRGPQAKPPFVGQDEGN